MKEELKAIKDTFVPWTLALLGVSVFVFTFGMRQTVAGFYYPFPSIDSISASLLRILMDRLIPSTVEVVALSPFNVFLSLISISLVLGLVVTFPLFFYKLVYYLSPGLYENERKGLLKISIPASLLFICGVLFAYYLVIPQTFSLLYMFAGAAGVGELFHVSQFVGLVLGLAVAVGLMFQLPIAMILLTRFGVVGNMFWREKWKHALVGILILTAFVTPDGSGISMAMLSLPLVGLYLAGMKISENGQRRVINVQEV